MNGRAWCETCQSRQDIEDVYLHDTGDSRRTVEEYIVTALACGHSNEALKRTYGSPLQQAGPTPAMLAPDPFLMEGE